MTIDRGAAGSTAAGKGSGRASALGEDSGSGEAEEAGTVDPPHPDHTLNLPSPPEPGPVQLGQRRSWARRVKRLLIGGKRELADASVFHKVSLIAFLAWVGLGADGLSSSAYGPEEAFKALGEHTYLAIGLAVATALTVLVISWAYSRIIELFPLGGGGYNVASRMLGPYAGVVSGSALVIDYVLTISISIAAGADAVFSFLDPSWNTAHLFWIVRPKLLVELLAIGVLIVLNLRGVRESVTILAPVFLIFLVAHAVLIGGVVMTHVPHVPEVAQDIGGGFSRGLLPPPLGLGLLGMLALFMRAYSMGGGTYTGIEAVSNGLTIMREPKVETGKRTMVLMAISLALTASGLVVSYLLLDVKPIAGKTMNAVLVERFVGGGGPAAAGLGVGSGFVLVVLLSEAFLLFVAAQAGFIDGPRVMANMATDSWLPHRFAQLSERLTTQNGILMMGTTAVVALLYTRGVVTHLVVMYSINVFLTFSLSMLSMCRYWLQERKRRRDWIRRGWIHAVGLVMCSIILAVTIYEKFAEGGWVTLVVTVALILLCIKVRRHYRRVQRSLKQLDDILDGLPAEADAPPAELDRNAPTAVLLVGSYGGLGIHSLLTIQRLFPGHFRNFIVASIGVVDAATFKNVEAVEEVRDRTHEGLRRYVSLARRLGLRADAKMAVGTEVVATAEELCVRIGEEFPRSIFFAAKLIFEHERWYQRLLHNETAYQLQRRLQFDGLNAMVLPVRVMAAEEAIAAASVRSATT